MIFDYSVRETLKMPKCDCVIYRPSLSRHCLQDIVCNVMLLTPLKNVPKPTYLLKHSSDPSVCTFIFLNYENNLVTVKKSVCLLGAL